MEEDQSFLFLMDKLFPFSYVKWCADPSNIDFEDCSPFEGFLTGDFLHLVMKAIWVRSNVLFPKGMWKFLSEVCDQLTSASLDTYIVHVVGLCQIVADITTDIHDRFISVFSLVTSIAALASRKCFDFYQLTPNILEVFYNMALKGEFYKQDGWKGLERFLQNIEYAKWYNKLRSITSTVKNVSFSEEFLECTQLKNLTLENDPLSIILEKICDDAVLDITRIVISTVEPSLWKKLNGFDSEEKATSNSDDSES
ncbi:hypothetical protein TNIN_314831 [Trichonephila inaurata madagascariensis]|uniref:Uncharacterized protein n=1 Tax=Trichonephila inaurata madagascariensis TaxID=2747483 RepID=A0A8X6XP01_9ARAC|nr:hypothetical protein TNIN_314831 [Trichonephila inaurata madagascariensis]